MVDFVHIRAIYFKKLVINLDVYVQDIVLKLIYTN